LRRLSHTDDLQDGDMTNISWNMYHGIYLSICYNPVSANFGTPSRNILKIKIIFFTISSIFVISQLFIRFN